jgi:hypothetical protein
MGPNTQNVPGDPMGPKNSQRFTTRVAVIASAGACYDIFEVTGGPFEP